MSHYRHTAVEARCAELGLQVDREGLARADAAARDAGLTQEQFDRAMVMHADTVKRLFTPTTYPWRHRLALAIHFLFNPRRWR